MLLALQQYGQKFSPGIWPWKHLSANWQRSRHLYCLPLKKQLTCPGHTPWIANLNPPPATTRYCDWGMLQKVPSRSKERLNNSVGSREYAWLQLGNRDTIFAPVWDLLWCLEEQKAEGKGAAHTVTACCTRHAELRPVGHFCREGLSTSLAREKLSGRYFGGQWLWAPPWWDKNWMAVLRIPILNFGTMR